MHVLMRVKLNQPGESISEIECEFEAGSIAEGFGMIDEAQAQLATRLKSSTAAPPVVNSETEAPSTTRRPRGRPAKDAVAPPPAPVPGSEASTPPAPPAATAPPAPPAPPPAPVDTSMPEDGSIPGFLARAPIPPAPAATPPAPPAATPPAPPPAAAAPPPPPAPPPAPVAPPAGVLAEKIVANLRERAKGTADNGKALADWIAASGLCRPGTSFEEALTVVTFCPAAQLQPIAGMLGVAV